MTSILLIEDDPAISMIVEEMLVDIGCKEVTVVGRLQPALEAARNGTFHCAILDLKLHGQETFEVAGVLTERGVPFAFFTGYGPDSLRQYRSQPVLSKPFAEADLKATVVRLVGKDPGDPAA